ncbi:alpha/beta hydrolase [Desertivirga brevis]|uniref:alpha/beta hydrolase n=1 Tax=Desertivirga brevis TaxID=2810310 RepID=UPI001A96BF70|nr:alpha/beta hydrolase-fold protein [Pedobacter sp. SYSU D00873]
MRKLLLSFIFCLLLAPIVQGSDIITLKSKYLLATDTVLLFKPEGYNQKDKYPVVFFLHGHSGNYRSYSTFSDLQEYADKYSCIIVCPDGLEKSWYIDTPGKQGKKFERFFMEELLPELGNRYQIDSSKFFISGFSMGGFGAMYLFIKYNSVFKSAGSTSGVLNLRFSGFKTTTLAELLGPYSDTNTAFDSYSPVNMLEQLKGTEKQIIFDCGTEDYLYPANQQFRAQCDKYKIKAKYTVQPGLHNTDYWKITIKDHMDFFSKQF